MLASSDRVSVTSVAVTSVTFVWCREQSSPCRTSRCRSLHNSPTQHLGTDAPLYSHCQNAVTSPHPSSEESDPIPWLANLLDICDTDYNPTIGAVRHTRHPITFARPGRYRRMLVRRFQLRLLERSGSCIGRPVARGGARSDSQSSGKSRTSIPLPA